MILYQRMQPHLTLPRKKKNTKPKQNRTCLKCFCSCLDLGSRRDSSAPVAQAVHCPGQPSDAGGGGGRRARARMVPAGARAPFKRGLCGSLSALRGQAADLPSPLLTKLQQPCFGTEKVKTGIKSSELAIPPGGVHASHLIRTNLPLPPRNLPSCQLALQLKRLPYPWGDVLAISTLSPRAFLLGA